MLRMEIACILILLFIAVIYFNAVREKNAIHRIYSCILVVLMVHLVFDAITVITVARLDTFPRFWNDILHRFFLATMLGVIYLYYRYTDELIKVERQKEKYTKPQQMISLLYMVYLVVAEFLLFITPVSYTVTEKGNFESGVGAMILYVSIVVYLGHITWNMIAHWNAIHPKKRLAILCAFIIELLVTILTMIDTSLLLAGMGLTLIAVSFYLVLENPDIKLVELYREEKKREEEANRTKSSFLSMVSHEIRTPMNAIVGMTDLLLREDHSETADRYLNSIKSSGDSLLMIVNDLLDHSKLEAGKMELIEEVYEMDGILRDVELIAKNRIDEKPIEFKMNIDEKLPKKLLGDGLRIRQILLNLVNNSVKYTQEGFVELSIRLVEEVNQEYYIRYSVKDTGQGIKEEDLATLFEAFTRVDEEKNHAKEGTGLGLSITRDFVRLMGGRVSVNSTYGEGSEFYFVIKQKKAPENLQTVKEKFRELEDKGFSIENANILIVDDTPMNVRVLKLLLDKYGVHADAAYSGTEAFEMIKKNHYDLVFMDYMMPVMDGAQTTGKVREMVVTELDPDKAIYYRTVPIIALTGDGSSEAREAIQRAGMNDFLEKPVNREDLNRVLLTWLPEECIKG